ncbi:hypothetical protein KA119_02640 [Candidatus Gracilibacteria bacterium]|nr:hypothetical protein [Candidatus Gracilibacteria bacterium]
MGKITLDNGQNLDLDIFNSVQSCPNRHLPHYIVDTRALVEKAVLLKASSGATLAYALKANSAGRIVKELLPHLDAVDCASSPEVNFIRNQIGGASKRLLFNNPKFPWGEFDMQFSYEKGVRHFTVDNMEDFITLSQLNDVSDIELIVRISGINNDRVGISFDNGPGTTFVEAIEILNFARRKGFKSVGVSFHVGSQNLDIESYEPFLDIVRFINSKVVGGLNIVNFGGGLPVNIYDDSMDIGRYMLLLANKIQKIRDEMDVEIIIEPGRALVADAVTLVVPIHRRLDRGNVIELRIPDGTFTSFMDHKFHRWKYPFAVYDGYGSRVMGNHVQVSLIGPTCDPADFIEDVYLPASVNESNFLVVPAAGAYMESQRTIFNFADGKMATYCSHYY